jgi:hypothetical protein
MSLPSEQDGMNDEAMILTSLPSVHVQDGMNDEARILAKRLVQEVMRELIEIIPGDQFDDIRDLFRAFTGAMLTSVDFPFTQEGDELIAFIRRVCIENQLKATDTTKVQYESIERRLNKIYFESIMQKYQRNIPVVVPPENGSDTAPETVVQTGNGTELQAGSVENVEDDAELEAGSAGH